MNNLSIRELHALRLAIFDNAEALHREADLLLKNGMYSRTYLLAHFCFEELGKMASEIKRVARRSAEVIASRNQNAVQVAFRNDRT